jgi:hypothetical protein
MGHLPVSKLLFECRMDKYEIRRVNLLALIHSRCGGKAAALAETANIAASYVSRMLYPVGKKGKKRIGEDVRDRIEDAFSLRRGSLDEEVETGHHAKQPEESPVASASSTVETEAKEVARVETTLERLSSPEKAVLELYRRASDKGKVMIESAASRAPKATD